MKFAVQRVIDAGVFSSQNDIERALVKKHPEKWKPTAKGMVAAYASENPNRPREFVDLKGLQFMADMMKVSFEWLAIGRGPLARVQEAPKSEPRRRTIGK